MKFGEMEYDGINAGIRQNETERKGNKMEYTGMRWNKIGWDWKRSEQSGIKWNKVEYTRTKRTRDGILSLAFAHR